MTRAADTAAPARIHAAASMQDLAQEQLGALVLRV
jgi:hypothetical protein